MKKEILALGVGLVAVVAASSVNAANVCSGGPGGSNAGSAISAGSNFVKVQFTPKCSANVILNFTENAVAAGVSSGSTKGRNVFSGGTNGGSVKSAATCANGCTTADVTDGLADSARDAS